MCTSAAVGSEGYRLPPPSLVQAIDRALADDANLRDLDRKHVSPDREKVILRFEPGLRPLAELAQPKWRANNEVFHIQLNTRRALAYERAARRLQVLSLSDGRIVSARLPMGARIAWEQWAPNSKYFACLVYRDAPGEVWLVDGVSGAARALTGPIVNSVSGQPLQWVDSERLLVTLIPRNQAPPAAEAVAEGPRVMDSTGSNKGSAAEGFLSAQMAPMGAGHERRLEYYATSEAGIVSLDGAVVRLPVSGMNLRPSASPDGRYVLYMVSLPPHRLTTNWSAEFPHRVNLYDILGRRTVRISERNTSDGGGHFAPDQVPAGRRRVGWRADLPATLYWFDALDGGRFDPKLPLHDELWQWSAPFVDGPRSLLRSDSRIREIFWHDEHLALLHEFIPEPARIRLRRFDPSRPGTSGTVLLDTPSVTDGDAPRHTLEYAPVHESNALGEDVLSLTADGRAAFALNFSRRGLRRLDLRTGRLRSFWPREPGQDEYFIALAGDTRHTALTVRSSAASAPNLHLRDLVDGTVRQLTHFTPMPLVDERTVKRLIVDARRDDGLPLRAGVFVPGQWEPGAGALPAFLWVYAVPRSSRGSYESALQRMAAGFNPYAPVFSDFRLLATLGYAVVDFDPPIVGQEGRSPYDDYIPQLVADMEAMAGELARRGIVDPRRMGVGGHSGGGMTAANVIAHTDMFRAGVASNGLFNRTLTPFGVSLYEERTLWQVPQNYVAMSPLFHADRIQEPLLILRGQDEEHMSGHPADPVAFYMAVRNLGGTARFVELPYEGHIPRGRESVLHIYAEVVDWLERYVRPIPAPPAY